MKKLQRCYGFGEFENTCENKPHAESKCWCRRCDDLRLKHLDKQFDELKKSFGITEAP